MLALLSETKLDFSFALGQPSVEILEGLRSCFIEKYGTDVYTKCTMIIIKEPHFFNVIKDIYGSPQIGLHNDLLEDVIDRHLEV